MGICAYSFEYVCVFVHIHLQMSYQQRITSTHLFDRTDAGLPNTAIFGDFSCSSTDSRDNEAYSTRELEVISIKSSELEEWYQN
jgi:hypothetical protein